MSKFTAGDLAKNIGYEAGNYWLMHLTGEDTGITEYTGSDLHVMEEELQNYRVANNNNGMTLLIKNNGKYASITKAKTKQEALEKFTGPYISEDK